jgi:hypothetical protein
MATGWMADADADADAEAVEAGETNLIKNPSCDNATANWVTLSGTPLESSTTFVHAGDMHSCHAYDRVNVEMSGSNASYDGPMQDITSAVALGHTYSVSVWALWVHPGTGSDAGLDGGNVEEGGDSGDGGARGEAGDASAGRPDTSVDSGGDASDASDGGEAGAMPGSENVYITVKETCGTTVTYNRVAEVDNLTEATWTQVSRANAVQVPATCASSSFQLYIEGPDVGLDLYTAEATLTFSR